MSVLDPAAPVTTAPAARRLMGSAYALENVSNADEARQAAGLDWEPIHRPLYVDLPDDIGEGGLVPVEKERAVVRGDSGTMFGVVGREHRILSNAEMFSFADQVLAAADTTWAACEPVGGSLGDGKQPFLAIQLGEGVQVAGIDAVNCALLLSNGHVGNTAFTGIVVPLRLSCSNMVQAAIRGKKGAMSSFTIQHSGNLDAKVQGAQEALAITGAYMREFGALADRMAAIDFDAAMFDDFLTELVPLSPDAGDRARKTVEDTRAAFRQNWRNTTTLTDDLKATSWGAINVIAEVIDHGNLDVRKSKVPAAERRVRSVYFGSGARLRDRAYSLLPGGLN
jgi:phage/plasmid-like protein (TIGR03299 family)